MALSCMYTYYVVYAKSTCYAGNVYTAAAGNRPTTYVVMSAKSA